MSKPSRCRSSTIATSASTPTAGDSAKAMTARSSMSISTACCWTFRAGSADSLDLLAEAVTQVGAEVVADHGILQRQIDHRRQPSQRCPGVISTGRAQHSGEGAVRRLDAQRVGQLDLPTGAGLHPFDLLEDVGRQHIATDDDEIARSIVDRRLLDECAGP